MGVDIRIYTEVFYGNQWVSLNPKYTDSYGIERLRHVFGGRHGWHNGTIFNADGNILQGEIFTREACVASGIVFNPEVCDHSEYYKFELSKEIHDELWNHENNIFGFQCIYVSTRDDWLLEIQEPQGLGNPKILNAIYQEVCRRVSGFEEKHGVSDIPVRIITEWC